MNELANELANLFSRAHPAVQFCILLALILALVLSIFIYIQGKLKTARIRLERDRLRNDIRDRELTIRELQGKLASAETLEGRLQEEARRAIEDRGRLFQDRDTIQCSLVQAEEQLDICRGELAALQTRFEALQRIDADVWKGPAPADAALPRFVPREERTTRFIAFMNLKGGVGKTTLVANLAAAYATGVVGAARRVLVVDLDYQGTLSNLCVSTRQLEDFRNPANHRTSGCLLDGDGVGPPSTIIPPLLATFDGISGNGRVIIADDGLDHIDFRQQARFAVERREVRFCHRRLFHDPSVLSQFDLVFFDCPPRLTTSTVNALAASDFIVIPTSLHRNDVDAVPRTLRWLDKLREMPTFQAQLAGVIINRTYRKATLEHGLTQDEVPSLDLLRASVQRAVPTGNGVLTNCVPNSPSVPRAAGGSQPLGTKPEGRELYGDVAQELYKRIV